MPLAILHSSELPVKRALSGIHEIANLVLKRFSVFFDPSVFRLCSETAWDPDFHPLKSLDIQVGQLCIVRHIDPGETVALEWNRERFPLFRLSNAKVAVGTTAGSDSLMKFQFSLWTEKALLN